MQSACFISRCAESIILEIDASTGEASDAYTWGLSEIFKPGGTCEASSLLFNQFFCFVCSDRKNQRELASLRDTVRLLTQDIDELKLSLSQAKSQLQPPSASEQRVLDATQPASPSPSSTNGMPTNESLPKPVINASNRLNDKRFNLVVYGINESQKGTPRHKRLQSDLERVVSVMSGLVSSINSDSIKDFKILNLTLYLLVPDPTW